jgi:hypothetical protein
MNFTRSDRKKYSVVDICQAIRREDGGSGVNLHTGDELREMVAWLEWRVDAGWDDSYMHRLSEYEAAIRAMAREVVKLGKALVKQLDDYEANRLSGKENPQ